MTKKSKKVLRGKLKEALKAYFDADVGSLNTYDLQIVAVEAFEELIKEKYIVVKWEIALFTGEQTTLPSSRRYETDPDYLKEWP